MQSSENTLNQGKGLSAIPAAVVSKLSIELLIELKQNGHGISFPSAKACQMRFKRDKLDFGGSFTYSIYGSASKAIKAAMSRYKQLCVIHPRPKAAKGLVSFGSRVNNRYSAKTNSLKGSDEYYYQVSYRKDGKQATKIFYMGSKLPTADQMLHTYQTARLFRYYFECFGNDFDFTIFEGWRTTRLYELNKPNYYWAGCDIED